VNPPARHLSLTIWLIVLAIAGKATAQTRKPGDAIWVYPESVIAYWSFDGSRLGDQASRERALAAAGLRGLIGNTIAIQGGSSIAGELLRGEVLGAFPYRACLLELEVEASAGKNGAIKPRKLGAVIEVRAPAKDHVRFQEAIDAALMADAQGDGNRPRTRKDITLPGGAGGQSSSTGEAWQEIAWASMPEAFVVAFGEETISRWVGAAPARTSEFNQHRGIVFRKRGRGMLVFEAYIDLNALRAKVPDEFDGRPLGDLLDAWKIANARSFMMHGALVALDPPADDKEPSAAGPSVLAIDVSWSARSEPPGTIGTVSVTESTWPEGITGKPEGATWAIAMRSSVRSWIDVGADTYTALGDSSFSATRARWERRVKPMLERIVPRIGEWTVVQPGLEFTLMVKKADGADRLAADLRALFSTLAPTLAAAGKSWELVVPDAEGALQGLTVRLDSAALLAEWKDGKK
jgi:hypothetical protein